MTADELIADLSLMRHPEGGWYRQTYSSEAKVQTSRGGRAASTAIYFLLREGEFSGLHRIASDEVWHFYQGSRLRVEAITPEGVAEEFVLGTGEGAVLQAWVPAGRWFGASLERGGWALVGCTVAPGFDFADFEMGERDTLLRLFPRCAGIVRRLTAPGEGMSDESNQA